MATIDRATPHLPPPGRIKVILCAGVEQALAGLESRFQRADSGQRLVTLSLTLLPRLEPLLDESLAKMAGIALAVWPRWYGIEDERLAATGPIGDPTALPGTGRGTPSGAWLRAAAACCRSGRPPLPAGFPRSLQAEQLALALAPEDLLLCLAVECPDAPPDRLYGFARAAEWLAQHTRARVLALLPESLAGKTALDSILYDAQRFPYSPSGGADRPRPCPEARHRLLPFVGEPHPYSPGEQALATALRRDPELAPLFGFNRHVTTETGIRYLVDLLWPAGRLVVEVDSYRYHGGPEAFGADRERDYELTASGYTVLRLTHDEALDDTPRAVAKIRRLVALQRERMTSRSQSP
ncbi:MAG: DUF559 domain-containing protein [Candidatus Competibacterales bacterium]|nr:DUF559 domain-containing protein [Candidatus Competibacterales bacterium]